MSPDQSLNSRLISLARLLEQLPAPGTSAPTAEGLATASLAHIPDERLASLGARLALRQDVTELDAEDALLLRLLLQDYVAAVGVLRARVREVEAQLLDVEGTIRKSRRAIRIARGDDGTSETTPTDA